MPVLNSQAVADRYPNNQPGAILTEVWNSRGGWFSVTGATAFVELLYGEYGKADWTEEIFLGAGAFVVLPANCRGVRFRNGVAGQNATVTAQIAQGDEPPLAISTIGQTNVVALASLNFQKNDLAIATEPTLDVMDAAGVITWTLADDAANTRVKLTPAFTNPALFPGNVGVGGNAGDTVISRLAAGVIGASNLSTGPTSNAVGGATTGDFMESTGRFLATRAANSSPTLGFSITGDTVWRFQIDTNGLIGWGGGGAGAIDVNWGRVAANVVGSSNAGVGITRAAAGNLAYAAAVSGDTVNRLVIAADGSHTWGPGGAAAGDVALARTAAGAPSSGGLGLTSAQTIRTTGTTGFVYTAATNNAALLSFFLASDANPAFKVFTQGALAWGPGGASALDLELARITNSPSGTGTFLELILGDGIGYGTGTGGTVTQATSFSTGVTLNQPTGKITLFTSAISAGLLISFVVTCSQCGINDTVVLSGDNMAGVVMSASVAAGSFTITWYSNGALASATRKINFAIIKGAVA